MTSSSPRKLPTTSSIRRRIFVFLGGAVVWIAMLPGCDRDAGTLITVYSRSLAVSIPMPAGWSTEVGSQGGFLMQVFTGPSVDVPERAGIRVQVMSGPMPGDSGLDEISKRYIAGQEVLNEESYVLHGFEGKTWEFISGDEAERSRLALVSIDETLYGLYAHGEAPTVEAYGLALDAIWEGFSLEREPFFETYARPELGLQFGYPRSWRRTNLLSEPGESLFVAFMSPPLAVDEAGGTIHATLEVSVNSVSPETTLEGFYTQRTELLGDNYRLVRHEQANEGAGISVLYSTETQLASYLERTFYFVEDGRSYIFKFITQYTVYHQVEPWIEEIAKSFQPPPEQVSQMRAFEAFAFSKIYSPTR